MPTVHIQWLLGSSIQFSPGQDGIYVHRKAHIRSTHHGCKKSISLALHIYRSEKEPTENDNGILLSQISVLNTMLYVHRAFRD